MVEAAAGDGRKEVHRHCKLLLSCVWCACSSHTSGLGRFFSPAETPPCHDLWNEATAVYSPPRASLGRAHNLSSLHWGLLSFWGSGRSRKLIRTVLKFRAYSWSRASSCTAPEHKPFTTQIRICLLQPLETFCSSLLGGATSDTQSVG